MSNVRLTAPEAQRATAAGDARFERGEPLHLTLYVGALPPESNVRVRWVRGADGDLVGEASQPARFGQRTMRFQAPEPAALDAGDYRVEVWVAGRKVHEQPFSLVDSSDDVVRTPG